MTFDPFAQPGRGGPSILPDVRPGGNQVMIGDDGNVTVVPAGGTADMGPESADHFDNLVEFIPEERLERLCFDLMDAIEQDKESRKERDRQYEEGLNRTGMGSNTIGGANFPGASRAVHPLLLEAAIDFGGGVMNEMLPPDGPTKAAIIGDENDQKNERAKRVTRYMNWQITELMQSAYHEFEVGFTQCALAGAFYTKGYEDHGNPAVAFVPIDQVYRPWNDGDFYNQVRITHAQNIDQWTFRENVRKKMWADVVVLPAGGGGQMPDETSAETANDRIIGREQPSQNIDGIRLVWETSCLISLMDDDDPPEPYLVTIDYESRKIIAVYRNWKKGDVTQARLDFLIEWPFWPWRGGYPVGMSHMIGSLSGAATGTLRALLDSGMLNATQTGVRLKGGATSGGQTLKPQVTEITEIQGSLAQDDIRKTFMPMQFNPPSSTLFQLLGFLVDAGRGVVRTTFDEYDKINGQTPVGTAQMFIEQGLKNFGSVHGRLHRSMRRFLKWLYQLNGDTLTPQTILDQQGEMTVQPQDFQGPMVVIPVSDPRIFSDLQRKAMAQTIAQRAQMLTQAQIPIYNIRATEVNFLRQYGVANPDQFLVPNPVPQQINAVAENVAASGQGIIKAYPGQDHESHIIMHTKYMESEMFGANPSIAPVFIPKMIAHLGEHLALWYSDAMLEGATAAIRQQTGNPAITLDSFMTLGVEVPLDRLMAQLDDHVLELAQTEMKEVPEAIYRARELLKKLAPPQPMDPSLVAQEDVQRQKEKDAADAKTNVIKLLDAREARERDLALKAQKQEQDTSLKAQKLDHDAAMAWEKKQAEMANNASHDENADKDRESREWIADENNQTRLEIAQGKDAVTAHVAEGRDDTAREIAEGRDDTAVDVASMRPKPATGGGSGGSSKS